MIPVNQENLARSAAPAADAANVASEGERQEETVDDRPQDSTAVEVKGDPEMAPVFLRHLLPVFTHVFQGTMVQSVRYVCVVTLLHRDGQFYVYCQPSHP